MEYDEGVLKFWNMFSEKKRDSINILKILSSGLIVMCEDLLSICY